MDDLIIPAIQAEEAINVRPFSDLIIPDDKFENFYRQFTLAGDLTSSPEWENFYRYFYEFDEYEETVEIGETKLDLEAYSPAQQAEEIEKCVYSFPYFCHKFVKILHPVHGTIPFVLYKYQRRVIDVYNTERFSIVSKFRQGGLTTVAVLYGLWKCLFQEGQAIYLLSKTDREAIVAGHIVDRALDNMPEWLWKNKAEISKHEKVFGETGSKICFYTPDAARGKSASLIIIDEAAFIVGMEDHWKAMYPVIATGGSVFVISTVNGTGNWYEEWYHDAEAGRNEFKVIDLDYWEHPEYATPEWERKTRSNMGDKAWSQEIERSFLGSGETYINARIIAELDRFTRENRPLRSAFGKWTNKIEEKKSDWDRGALWIWKEPVEGHEYIIGVDCAEGVGDEGDNSCFEIMDISTLEQVAEFYSNQVPPVFFAQTLNQIGIYYNTALIVVEGNAIGGAVLNTLYQELGYENLYFEPKGRQDRPGIKIGANNRSVYLESMQQRFINGTIKINSRRLVNELRTFRYNAKNRRAEAEKRKHDDAIMALCIALCTRDTQLRGIPIGAEVPKELTSVFKSDVYEEIRKEIMENSPMDMLSKDDMDPFFFSNENQILSNIDFDISVRKHDKLLKEFGW